jgi:hypothetical protein
MNMNNPKKRTSHVIFFKYIDAHPYIYRMSTHNYTHHTLDACGIKRLWTAPATMGTGRTHPWSSAASRERMTGAPDFNTEIMTMLIDLLHAFCHRR